VTVLQGRKIYSDAYLFGSLSAVERREVSMSDLFFHVCFQVSIEPESDYIPSPQPFLSTEILRIASITNFTLEKSLPIHDENMLNGKSASKVFFSIGIQTQGLLLTRCILQLEIHL
jgi:hypothetical protein